jgi:hypothetical protein
MYGRRNNTGNKPKAAIKWKGKAWPIVVHEDFLEVLSVPT